jgi:hypothetical protein
MTVVAIQVKVKPILMNHTNVLLDRYKAISRRVKSPKWETMFVSDERGERKGKEQLLWI